MIRAIISDLDGTILPRKGEISADTLRAFRFAGQKQCKRIIATGRNLYSAQKVLPPDFPIDYLVFSSGAGVMRWRDRKILTSCHLSGTEAHHIAGYLWNYNINFTIQREIPDNHYFYYTDLYPLHEDYKNRVATYAPFGTLISSPENIQGEATQFVLILDALQIRLLDQIRQDLKDFSIVRSTSPIDNKAIWLEIFASGINKGSTCRELLGQLNISCEECAGIGNDYNDVDFLDICGKSYLVANAPENLHRHYKLVKADREEGFAEFVGEALGTLKTPADLADFADFYLEI